jgi:hypothetical protein
MTPRERAIEAAAQVIFNSLWPVNNWADSRPGRRDVYIKYARVAIDAYLAALEAEGEAKKAECFQDAMGYWTAYEQDYGENFFPVLIIKL